MLTVILGLSGAITYGIADFFGGLASRGTRPIIVTAIAAAVGIVPLLVAASFLHTSFTSNALVWGAVAGLCGSIGVLLLYIALAVGPMSVLSPLTSVFTALLPVVVGLLTGTRMSVIGICAMAGAIVAVVLVATSRNTSGAHLTARGVLIAAVAGCGFGGLVLAYNSTSAADGIAPLIVARVVQTVVMCVGAVIVLSRARAVAADTRGSGDPTDSADSGNPADSGGSGDSAGSGDSDDPRTGRIRLSRRTRFWLIVVACGVFDASANVFIQAGLHVPGDTSALPVISVLNALYPVGTIVLAAVVLRERLTWLQLCGLGLAFASSAVLAVS
ncbi:EamA family transporter [Gryllotalpicola reticulitermitis]|uniref:EamA family transporter n=1 Tax=Gryllotalpicola reticulitermitis TaxID=1184153 RepID=A0ABV8Q9D4_9MICO